MDISNIQATVFYKHQPEEVAALSAAIVPMADHIRAVSGGFERIKTKAILNGEHFRAGDAKVMRNMLLRAAKYARIHLDEYFPTMRDGLIESAEQLEEAVADYWREFHRLQNELIPTK
jgi:hypothetical protein